MTRNYDLIRHEAAVAILARSGDQDQEAYLRAFESPEAAEQVRATILEETLREKGHAPDGETVTRLLIYVRMQEILGEQGFFTYQGGDTVLLPDEETERRAARQAIDELGLPGEKRKDLADVRAAARGRLIGEALADGRILPYQVGSYADLWEKEPQLAAKMLAAAKPHPDAVTYGAHWDPESAELDAAARQLVKASGRSDDDTEAYLSAVEAVTAVTAVTESFPMVAAAAIEQHSVFAARGAAAAAAVVAREARERREAGDDAFVVQSRDERATFDQVLAAAR